MSPLHGWLISNVAKRHWRKLNKPGMQQHFVLVMSRPYFAIKTSRSYSQTIPNFKASHQDQVISSAMVTEVMTGIQTRLSRSLGLTQERASDLRRWNSCNVGWTASSVVVVASVVVLITLLQALCGTSSDIPTADPDLLLCTPSVHK
jgi:hypothetical protein